MRREASRAHLVGNGAHRPLGRLGLEQLREERLRCEVGVARLRGHLRVVGRHAVQLHGLQSRDDFGAHGAVSPAAPRRRS